METAAIVAFLGAAVALVVSPGPDTLLILRNTLGAGRKAGFATVAGVQLGLAVHTTVAALGLSVALAAMPGALTAIGVAGALYLGWLGWQSLGGGFLPPELADGGKRVGSRRAFLDAALTNLLNPKVILLFLALMPQFVHAAPPAPGTQLAVLGGVLIAINIVWQAGLALAAEGARRWLLSPLVQRRAARGTGAFLLLLALAMLADRLL